ncbi:MAG: hypothetical protein M3296_01635, partial [Actinomycetota bacterium]|nr:hypothetical protein [Actinomycetota bacterium]
VSTDRRCYQETQDVVLSGAGFRPRSTVTITRQGTAIGTRPTDGDGAFVGKFPTRELRLPRREALFRLGATDGTAVAQTSYQVTKVFADFAPGRGNLATLRVRFAVNGFALLRARPGVFLHYVRPNGRVRRTVRLGTARGNCGHIKRTGRRRLFPFRAEPGRWILQFDTRRRYRRARQSSRFIWVRKPVQVFRPGG